MAVGHPGNPHSHHYHSLKVSELWCTAASQISQLSSMGYSEDSLEMVPCAAGCCTPLGRTTEVVLLRWQFVSRDHTRLWHSLEKVFAKTTAKLLLSFFALLFHPIVQGTWRGPPMLCTCVWYILPRVRKRRLAGIASGKLPTHPFFKNTIDEE